MDEVKRVPSTEQVGKEYAPDMRITMAIPHKKILGHIPDISIHTLNNFKAMAEATAKAEYEVFVNTESSGSNTPVTREQIVSQFKGDWLLMIDPDALPMPDTANKLLMAAKEDRDNLKKIVCVPAVRTSYPYFACFGEVDDSGYIVPWMYGKEITDEDIDAVELRTRKVGCSGFHTVLIHRTVFEQVPWPWFPLNVVDAETGERYGHDYTFCRRAKQIAGVDTWVEFSCRVGHLGLKAFTLADNRAVLKSNPLMVDEQERIHVNPDLEVPDDIHDPVNYVAPGHKSVSVETMFPKGAVEDENSDSV